MVCTCPINDVDCPKFKRSVKMQPYVEANPPTCLSGRPDVRESGAMGLSPWIGRGVVTTCPRAVTLTKTLTLNVRHAGDMCWMISHGRADEYALLASSDRPIASISGGQAINLRQRSRRRHAKSACLPGDYRSAMRITEERGVTSSAGRGLCMAAAFGSPSGSNLHLDGLRPAAKPCSPLGNHRMLCVTDLTPSKTMVMQTRGATVTGHPAAVLSPSDLQTSTRGLVGSIGP